ncbi:energy-coupling factor transporter transmembrane component T family protein [Chloroflexota bacterium]
MKNLKYQDRGTVIHRLNPLPKLTWGGGVLVLSLLFDHPLYVLSLLVVVIALALTAKIGREWFSIMNFSLWLGASVIVINALVSYHGAHVLVEAPFKLPVMGTPVITVEAIAFGTVMALRLLVIISTFTLLNLTIHPDDIMAALLKMKFPYKSVMITSLSTRFVPCLIEDESRISDGHRARGLELENGSWLRRVKNRAVITVPLLANSLDRAVQVAEAMEARAFGTGKRRTYYKDIKITPVDAVMLGYSLLPLAFGILVNFGGYGDYQYYPVLQAANTGLREYFILFVLVALLIMILPLALLKRRLDLD